MNNCIIVILGATGDLAKRKLIPALYTLVVEQKIKNYVIVGAALDDTTARDMVVRAKPFIASCDEAVWNTFIERVYYQSLHFKKKDDFKKLEQLIADLEKKYDLSGNRLFYCATASTLFCPITEYLVDSGAMKKMPQSSKIWNRIVYEKPFGYDLHSAHEINDCIARLLHEDQVYRVDHYLTEELVSNIALVRFTNCIFEPLWNNRFIDNVQIILSENVCLEGRGSYYDSFGALRDVLQNHMLELLALIAMEAPEELTGEYIRRERAKVLEKVHVSDALLGQYDGYAQESGVKKDSKTETFAFACLAINNQRWARVPFYLKTGKCLDKKETVIHITFKQVDCLLAKQCPSASNCLTIQVSPDALFSLCLNVKKTGFTNEVMPVKMEFCHSCFFGKKSSQAYEVLLEQVLRGEQSVSVRFDEIEYAWNIVDAIKAMKLPVYRYKSGSLGPKEVEGFEKKHKMRWRS